MFMHRFSSKRLTLSDVYMILHWRGAKATPVTIHAITIILFEIHGILFTASCLNNMVVFYGIVVGECTCNNENSNI